MEFLAFDKELNEVAQALDDAAGCLLPHPQSNSATRGPHIGPPTTLNLLTLKVNWTVMMKWI